MTEKIIFWFSADLLPYCLAHFFQKQRDSELFAIFDVTNKPKEFFKKQEFIKFTNFWFYHDQMKFEIKPDIDYIENIEKKYNLDISEMIDNDRILNHYNEYYNFNQVQKNIILQNECKFFENILDQVKPDYFITTETTLQPHHLFYEMCKKRGVKILMLNHETIHKAE